FKIYLFYPGLPEFNPVLFPEPVFVRLEMFKFHMAHIHVHQGGAGEEVITFRRDHRDLMPGKLAHVPGGRDACNSVSYDHYMFHSCFIFLKIGQSQLLPSLLNPPSSPPYSRGIHLPLKKREELLNFLKR